MNPIVFALVDALRATIEFLYRQGQVPESSAYPVAETFVIGDLPGVFYDFNHRAALITISRLNTDTITLHCGKTQAFTRDHYPAEQETGIFTYIMPATALYQISEIAVQWLRDATLLYQNEGGWMPKPFDNMEEIMMQIIASRVDVEQNLPPVPAVDLYLDAITYGELSASFVTSAREDAQREKENAQRILEMTDRHPFDDRFPRNVEHRAAQAVMTVLMLGKWYRELENPTEEDKITLIKSLASIIKEVYRQDKEGM